MTVTLTLSTADVELICSALETHEYWDLGYQLPRHDGAVFLPGDSIEPQDPFWPASPTEEEVVAIESVRRSRALAEILAAALTSGTGS
jgi:hypothetical protein